MGVDVYGKNPTTKEGEYFQASWWTWRPIVAMCEQAEGRSLPEWGYNSNAGYKSQEECDTLADRLEKMFLEDSTEFFSIEDDLRVDKDGCFLPKSAGQSAGFSAYVASRHRVKQFVKFLRECGGFTIT